MMDRIDPARSLCLGWKFTLRLEICRVSLLVVAPSRCDCESLVGLHVPAGREGFPRFSAT